MPSDSRRSRRPANTRSGPTPPQKHPLIKAVEHWLVRLGLTIAIAGGAGWLCDLVGVPLPWMVGPLIVTAIQSIWLGSPYVPVQLRWAGQLVVASAVALNLTPHTLEVVASDFGFMLTSALLIIPVSLGLAAITMRASGVDRATALFSSLPGGPMEMATLAEQSGGKGALVAFSQTLRIAAIVTLIPPLLILFGAHFESVIRQTGEIYWPYLMVVMATAFASALILRQFGGANAFFLGPLLGVGALTMLEGPTSPVPGWLVASAQVALGLTLGRMFDRNLVLSARQFIVSAASISGILVGLSVVLAIVFATIGDHSFNLYVLANAPGSVTEMAVAAKGLHLDASLVTAFHVTRVIIILPAAGLFYRGFIRLTDWIEARKKT